jgi:hypothetical protein
VILLAVTQTPRAGGQAQNLPAQCFSSAANPVACYEAGTYSGSTWTDQSGKGNHLTIGAGQLFSPLVPGAPSGLLFSGSGGASRASYTPALASTFTLAVWVYISPTGPNPAPLFFVSRSQSNIANQLAVWSTGLFDYGATWGFSCVPFAASCAAMSPAPAPLPIAGTWQHIALVRNGNTASWYMNGVFTASLTSSVSVTYSAVNLNLGVDPRGSNSWGGASTGCSTCPPFYMKGSMGQVVVLNTALAAADIAAMYVTTLGQYWAPKPPSALTYLPTACGSLSARPVACYESRTFSGSTWTDLSGNGNDLVLSGTFAFSALVPGSPGGLYLSGNANAYRAQYAPTLADKFTYAAWVWAAPSAAGNVLFSVSRSSSAVNGELQIWTNAFFDWSGSFGFNPTYAQNAAVSPPAGAWTHIVLVRSGLTAYWYLNGAPNGVVQSAQGFSVPYLNTFLNLGCDLKTVPATWAYFTGYLGQVVVLNTALAASDVTALYSATKPQYVRPPPPPPPLPPPPLTYADFPGCAAAANVRACYALADLYVATQVNVTAWTAALAAPGANAGGWPHSPLNYCAWRGVGCANTATAAPCFSDSEPDCELRSLCAPGCRLLRGARMRLTPPTTRLRAGRCQAGASQGPFRHRSAPQRRLSSSCAFIAAALFSVPALTLPCLCTRQPFEQQRPAGHHPTLARQLNQSYYAVRALCVSIPRACHLVPS